MECSYSQQFLGGLVAQCVSPCGPVICGYTWGRDVDVDVTVAASIIDSAREDAEPNSEVDDNDSNSSQSSEYIVHYREDVTAEGVASTVLGTAILASGIVVLSLRHNNNITLPTGIFCFYPQNQDTLLGAHSSITCC